MGKKEILCEIIGIILGDGYLRYDTANYKYGFNISLNGIDDYDYYQYVKKLSFKNLKVRFNLINI